LSPLTSNKKQITFKISSRTNCEGVKGIHGVCMTKLCNGLESPNNVNP
jgi:hypothetical protein